MFDIGFFELLLCAIVALVVIGPDRMPAFARTAGKWVGRLRRTMSDVKTEISREIKADELREILAKQAQITSLEEIIELDKPASNPKTEISTDANNPAKP